MKGKEICVCLLVIVFLIGVPGSGYCSFFTGNELVEWMRDYDIHQSGGTSKSGKVDVNRYILYIAGVADVLQSLGLIRAKGVTVGQHCAVVTKYLKANPEKWHQSALSLILEALFEAFPLESRKEQPK